MESWVYKNKLVMILVLGDGLMATEVIGRTGWQYISRSNDNFDFSNKKTWIKLIPKETTTIINLIANTDTYNDNRKSMLSVNYNAVCDLVDFCNENKITLIHYSTDYVYAGSVENANELDIPIPANNWYAYSKLLADEYIMKMSNDYLICRGSHKLNPFPYPAAWTDQYTNADYVNKIAKIFIRLIRSNARGLFNIGTPTKTIHELASISRNGVEEILAPHHVPKNVTMDLTKMEEYLKLNFEESNLA